LRRRPTKVSRISRASPTSDKVWVITRPVGCAPMWQSGVRVGWRRVKLRPEAWQEHSLHSLHTLQLTGLVLGRKLAFEANAVGSEANSMFLV
jgi:hypothetical protein